jgi:hypothetical protein
MPKIGAKADDRPYNLRCAICGCHTEKLISRFGFSGKPAAHAYRCSNPYHNCGDETREGCKPYRAYGEPIAHGSRSGEHPGRPEDCTEEDCAYRSHAPLTGGGERHPGSLGDCTSAECEPPFDRGPWGDWPPAEPTEWPPMGSLAGDYDD